MKYLPLLALLLLTGPAQAQKADPEFPYYCNAQATAPAGFTTKVTLIVAPTPTARILVCGWVVSMVAAGTITFQYGTGTNCTTTNSPTPWGPTINPSANNNNTYIDSSPVYRGMGTPAGNDLCITATNAANATVYYTIR